MVNQPTQTCTQGSRRCKAHGEPQSISEFRRIFVSQKFTKTCANCRKVNRKNQKDWRNRNPELSRQRHMKWYREHREECSAKQNEWRARMSPEERSRRDHQAYERRKARKRNE